MLLESLELGLASDTDGGNIHNEPWVQVHNWVQGPIDYYAFSPSNILLSIDGIWYQQSSRHTHGMSHFGSTFLKSTSENDLG